MKTHNQKLMEESSKEASKVIDKYIKGEISYEEYNKQKELLMTKLDSEWQNKWWNKLNSLLYFQYLKIRYRVKKWKR